MKCYVCASKIKEKYYYECEQYHKKEQISIKTILKDLFGNIFSLEKSFLIAGFHLKNINIILFVNIPVINIIWNSKVFELSNFKRFMYIFLYCILQFLHFLLFINYLTINNKTKK